MNTSPQAIRASVHSPAARSEKSPSIHAHGRDAGALHTMHTPKGECAKCASEMPSSHTGALCSECAKCAERSSPEDVRKALVRESLNRVCPGLTALADGLRERFGTGVKIEGVMAPQHGQMAGAGRFAPDGELAKYWTQATVDNGATAPDPSRAPHGQDVGARGERRAPDSGNPNTQERGK